MSRGKKDSDAGVGFIVFVLVAIIAMPLVGLFLLAQKDPTARVWGGILTVVGIVLWIILAVIGA